MANRRGGYIERDSRGRERIVLPRRSRSNSHQSPDRSTRILLNEAEEHEAELTAQVNSLQTRLSFSERNEWQLRQQLQTLANEHGRCRHLEAQLDAQVREVRRLEELLDDEEDKTEKLTKRNEKLEEKIRLLKRGLTHEDYRGRYEEKLREMELLRQILAQKSELVRVADVRVADRDRVISEKNGIIVHLKDYLNQLGYRVEL